MINLFRLDQILVIQFLSPQPRCCAGSPDRLRIRHRTGWHGCDTRTSRRGPSRVHRRCGNSPERNPGSAGEMMVGSGLVPRFPRYQVDKSNKFPLPPGPKTIVPLQLCLFTDPLWPHGFCWPFGPAPTPMAFYFSISGPWPSGLLLSFLPLPYFISTNAIIPPPQSAQNPLISLSVALSH